MESIMELLEAINLSLENLKRDYHNAVKDGQEEVDNNKERIKFIETEVNKFNHEIEAKQEELKKVEQDYAEIQKHVEAMGLVSSSSQLLDETVIGKISQEASTNKENTVAKINDETKDIQEQKINLAQEQDLLGDKIQFVTKEIETLKTTYLENESTYLNTLENLQKDIDLFLEDIQRKVEKSEEKIEDKEETLVEEEPKEEEIEILSFEESEADLVKEPFKLEEPVVEELEIKEESPVIEEIEELQPEEEPKVEEELQPEEEPKVEEELQAEESAVETIYKTIPIEVLDNSVDAEKVYLKTETDYSLAPYANLEELELSESQMLQLKDKMSSEKYIELITLLKENKIDLKDIKEAYNEFINIEEVETVSDTLSTLNGIGKSNDEKDYSYNLDIILNEDNNGRLHDNIMGYYASGENPGDKTILELTSPHSLRNKKEADELGVSAKHRVALALAPLASVMAHEESLESSKEKVRRVA